VSSLNPPTTSSGIHDNVAEDLDGILVPRINLGEMSEPSEKFDFPTSPLPRGGVESCDESVPSMESFADDNSEELDEEELKPSDDSDEELAISDEEAELDFAATEDLEKELADDIEDELFSAFNI
jgi:hypothetical protein